MHQGRASQPTKLVPKELNTKVVRTVRSEALKEQPTQLASRSIHSAINRSWLLFCLAVLALKFLLLGLDPLPKLYYGDSLSYLWTGPLRMDASKRALPQLGEYLSPVWRLIFACRSLRCGTRIPSQWKASLYACVPTICVLKIVNV
jgi:hypothetical protein